MLGLAQRGRAAWLGLTTAGLLIAACKSPPKWEVGKKFLHYPLSAKVGTLEPVRNSSQYDNFAQSQVYETLFQYKYLVRPFALEPLLLDRMPEVSDDQLRYRFQLKSGVLFHDDPCFELTSGVGREMTAQDVIWSLMRMADKTLAPNGWWLYKDRIEGFDEFQERMNARAPGEPFDWDANIAGLKRLGGYTFEIKLQRPFPQFLYVLAMGYSAIVPRECSDFYGQDFGNHAVGTGPFILKEWIRGSRLRYEKNPKYRDERYPGEANDEYEQRGLLEPAGKRVPFLDGLVFHVYEQDQPMWLKFRVGDLDMARVPAEFHDAVFDAKHELRDAFRRDGVQNENVPLLDFIYRGFNMDDPIVGKGESALKLRRALSLALNTAELNDAFYNDTAILYDGPIAPTLDGYEPGVISAYRGPKIEEAKRLLAEAGYPEGRGLPAIQYHTNRGSGSVEQAEMVSRQFKRIGVKLEVQPSSFPELSEKLKRRKAQMFSLAWGADYPDAENFLQLFYGPNQSPGSNGFNYDNPAFNQLYVETRSMQPSPERTAIYKKMRDIIIEDCPAIGSMARTRYYLWNKRAKYVLPSETDVKWFKYLDVERR